MRAALGARPSVNLVHVFVACVVLLGMVLDWVFV